MTVVALDTSHPVPAEALGAHLGVLGKTGSGKTYAAKGIVESLLRAGQRVVIIDPTGAWWGLRSSADGQAAGFPVAVFGGDHADVPLSDAAGERLGALLAERSLSAIVDVSEFSNASVTRFMEGFLGELYRANKRPLHLVIDEADAFAPQRALPNQTKVLHHVSQIVRRGRLKGFRCVLITQRPATIHKDVITQINALIALRVMSPQDRKAIEEWVKGQADAEAGKLVLDSLAKLDRGEGWIWAPEADVLKRTKFPRITTFDSSRTPDDGEVTEPETLADVDVEALRDALGSPEEPAGQAGAPSVDVAAIRKAARDEGYRAGFGDGLAAGLEQARAAIEALKSAETAPEPKAPAATQDAASAPRRERPPAAPSVDGLTRPQTRILEALAFWAALGFETPTREQVAAAAGYSATSGGFSNLLGQLRTAGLLTYPAGGTVALTDAGRSAAPAPDGRSARDRLSDILSGPQQAVLDAIPRDGRPIIREELAAAAGYSPTSGGFSNLLGSLRTLGVIDYPARGAVVVEPWVWSTPERA